MRTRIGEHPRRTPATDHSTPEEGLMAEDKSKGRLFRISTSTRSKSRTAEAVSNKITWLCSLFFLIYVGTEVSIGGWVVTFMLRVRHGSPFASGLTSTGFWSGITIGRVVLGFATARLFKTEKHAVAIYLVACGRCDDGARDRVYGMACLVALPFFAAWAVYPWRDYRAFARWRTGARGQ